MPPLPITSRTAVSALPSPAETVPKETFVTTWHIWRDSANSGLQECRWLAVERMIDCLESDTGSLDISCLGLTDLPTLPPNTRSLLCENNKLTALPPLPPQLRELDCSDNQGITLPPLPENLISIKCNDNKLNALPKLPRMLKELHCTNNEITQLPPLPHSLTKLFCGFNNLTILSSLPDGLITLSCEFNQLTAIPSLNLQLNHLTCDHNKIKVLPKLTKNILKLTCGENNITQLPELPKSLTYLHCQHTEITQLPELPKKLRALFCGFNKIKKLPPLPDSLITLHCNNNQITSLPLIPPNIQDLNTESNPVSLSIEKRYIQPDVIAEILAVWGINEISSWIPLLHEENCSEFFYFLSKLTKTNSLLYLDFRKRIRKWLERLSLVENSALREQVFQIAYDATTSCHDKLFLSLNCMMMADLEIKTKKAIENGDYDPLPERKKLIDIGLQFYRVDLLNKIALKKVSSMEAEGQQFDEVEVHLYYQYKLRSQLNLPEFMSRMRYLNTVNITTADLRSAVQEIKTSEQTDFLPFLATKCPVWQSHLRRHYKEPHDTAVKNFKETASDESILQQKITQYLLLHGFPTDNEEIRIQTAAQITAQMELEAMIPLTRQSISDAKWKFK